jgi:outer membrane protein TolC
VFARTLLILIVALCCATGCASRRTASKSTAAPIAKASEASSADKDAGERTPEVIATAYQLDSIPSDATPPTIPGPELLPVPIDAPLPGTTPEEVAAPSTALELGDVVASVQANFPLIQAAMDERQIKSGEELASWGAFDHKLKAASETEPLGYYENYRHGIGVERDTMWGGKTVAGYRIGRGSFEPWYLERQTNEGGEFKAGFLVPLAANRWIDPNRAALWRAQVARNQVEPEIQSQVVSYVRDGSILYWNWVAAGQVRDVAQSLLEIAQDRNRAIKGQVDSGDRASIDLVDNERLIVSRQAKLIDAEQKLDQSAIKLSLFFRSPDGTPLVLDDVRLPDRFPPIEQEPARSEEEDIEFALTNRPDAAVLNFARDQLEIERSAAENMTQPEVYAGLLGSQDVGAPTSPKRDKSPFELEASLTLEVPIERRKAFGKLRAAQGKISQLNAKQRYLYDKIAAEVQSARVALEATRVRVARSTESLQLAVRMEEAERRNFELGNSSLLDVNLREQQAVDAAIELVVAQLDYYQAKADYAAALGLTSPGSELSEAE